MSSAIQPSLRMKIQRREWHDVTAILPLIDRFPSLSRVPRVSLARIPTPLESLTHVAPGLWIKRDDRSGMVIGGNKVRALEFLLAGVRPGDEVVTAGGVGSTHAVATALCARTLGATASVALWRQQMNPWAERVSATLVGAATRRHVFAHPVSALMWAQWRRFRGAKFIAPGGTTPLGILGHVNAALEVAQQIRNGDAPTPTRVVVPLGTGGTAAGLALGLRIAGLDGSILLTRVVPRLVGRVGRVVRLANATARLIEQYTGERLPRIRRRDFELTHTYYGGAYGCSIAAADAVAARLAPGIVLDSTYSAKACAAAIDACGEGATLFWLTFDADAIGTALSAAAPYTAHVHS